MNQSNYENLTRRERQIMDVVYRLGRATVGEVLEQLEDPPSYTSVRTQLRILEQKGHLQHAEDGPRYVYSPTVPRETVRTSALHNVLRNFFEGSREQMMAAMLDEPVTNDELERLAELIERARKEGR